MIDSVYEDRYIDSLNVVKFELVLFYIYLDCPSLTSKKDPIREKLVSHWHANFVAYFRTTFVRLSHECHENFHVSRTGREGFIHVLKFYANFLTKIFRKNVVKVSGTCRREILANLPVFTQSVGLSVISDKF